MKNIFTCLIIAILISGPIQYFMPSASAQSWVWGRGNGDVGDDAWAVATDHAGNVWGAGIKFATGTFTFGSYTIPSSPGTYQAMWVKYDAAGTVLWADGAIATGSGQTYINNIAVDASNNLILFGTFTSTTIQLGSITLTNTLTGGRAQYFIAKVSPTGTVLWAIADGNVIPTYMSVFGAYVMSVGGVTTDPAGNIYITSSFSSPTMTVGTTTLTNAGTGSTYDAFVAKYSPTGTMLWASSIGGTKHDYGYGVAVASSGEVYITGAFLSPSMTIGASTVTNTTVTPFYLYSYIAKFSATGAPLWGQSAGGTRGAFGVGIVADNSGHVYMTGGFCDASITFGTTTITRTYPAAAPQLALYLVQYTVATDAVTWSKTIGSASQGVYGYSIGLASCGQVWVCGNYREDVDIDGTTLAVVTDGKISPDPVFIAGYNLAGGVVGSAGLSSGADDQVCIACDDGGNVFLCSDYFVPFTVGTDVFTGGFSEYFYVAKYANSVAPPDSVFVAHDTAYCGVAGATLHAPPGYSSYYWDDASGLPTRTVTSPGTYLVYCTTCGITTHVDTFHVTTTVADTSYTNTDTNICAGIGSAVLTGTPGYPLYSWNTGPTTSSITVTTSGTYICIATNGCAYIVDTFHFVVDPNDTTRVRIDTGICSSFLPYLLNGPGGYATYSWSTGSSASFIPITASGTYVCTATNATGCSTVIDTYVVTVLAVPVVNLGPDTAFCVGNTLTLTSPQPAGSTYAWSTGSSASSISVSTSGVYSLTVTYANGCRTTDARDVLISPIPIVDLGPDTAICSGVIPTLQSVIPYPSGATYIWSTGATTPSVTASLIGTYWLQVTVGGCPGADTIDVKNLWDTLNFQMVDTAICRGAHINVRAAGTPGMTYQWLPTAGIPVSTIPTAYIEPDTSATYTIRASISSCPDIIRSFHVDVQPNPIVSVVGTRHVCHQDTGHLHASVSPSWYTNYKYSWSPGANLDDSTQGTVVFSPGDSQKIVLTVTTSAGCKGSDSALLIVFPWNQTNLDTIIRVCPHDSATLVPKMVDAGTTFRWHPALYLNDSLSPQPKVKPITSQAYWAVTTTRYGCLDTIHANVLVSAGAQINLGDSITLYPGESYTIPTQSNCLTYTWFPPAGLNNSRIQSPTAKPLVSTRYIVKGITEWGCVATDTINIYVNPESLLQVPNAFTPGSGANNTYKILKRGEASLNYFRIFNRWGNMVFETKNIDEGWDGTYKGKLQQYGVYVYELEAETSTGKVFHKKGNLTLIK